MYDLHSHTYYSDGTDSPEELITRAKAAGLRLIAVTDHDTVAGLPEAEEAARKIGMPFLPGAEIEAAYHSKLHILGVGIDPRAQCIKNMLDTQARRRAERNEAMLSALDKAGLCIRPYYNTGRGCSTRTHIANALVAAGYASDMGDAFTRLIGRGMPYFVDCRHPSMQEVVGCINEAGGLAVLAHPHKMKCDHEALVRELADCGLWGLEAYYPGVGPETREYFIGLAKKYGLNITCGSDHHGANRPGVSPGCAWRPVPELEETFNTVKELAI